MGQQLQWEMVSDGISTINKTAILFPVRLLGSEQSGIIAVADGVSAAAAKILEERNR